MKIKVLNTHANENIKYYFPLLKKEACIRAEKSSSTKTAGVDRLGIS